MPRGWRSFPGLIRYDEAFGAGEITHAFRVTTRDSNGYVWPASHAAGTQPERAADGHTPSAEGVEEHFDIHA